MDLLQNGLLFFFGVITGAGLMKLLTPIERPRLSRPAELVKPPALTRYGVGLMGTDEYKNEQRGRTARLRQILDEEMQESTQEWHRKNP